MVEKKEFAVLFRKSQKSESVEEFFPLDVIEGKYNEQLDCFEDDQDIKYYHIDLNLPKGVFVGYGFRTTIEVVKNSLTNFCLDIIKRDILDYAKEVNYIRDFSKSDCIVAIHKESGNEYLFEDIDNSPSLTEEDEEKKEESKELSMTPMEIEAETKKTIKGQDAAIKTIATCLWATINNRNLTKKQMLLIGPTGVGKTAIFEKLQKILDIPVIIFSVPGLSQAGYTGRSTDEILKHIYYECDENLDKAENCIVILDEIDKIAFNKENTSADVSTIGVQNELLKMVEGYRRVVEIENGMDSFTIDTSNIIFVASGAFQNLFEKQKTPIGFANIDNSTKYDKNIITTDMLVNYGLKRELIGRFPIKVKLNNLTREIMREIILESDESELLAHTSFLEKLGVKISNLDEIIDIIINDALSKEIGARGLVETISNLLLGVIYEVANNPDKYNEVIIGKNILKDPYDFELIETKTKKRVKTQTKKG